MPSWDKVESSSPKAGAPRKSLFRSVGTSRPVSLRLDNLRKGGFIVHQREKGFNWTQCATIIVLALLTTSAILGFVLKRSREQSFVLSTNLGQAVSAIAQLEEKVHAKDQELEAKGGEIHTLTEKVKTLSSSEDRLLGEKSELEKKVAADKVALEQLRTELEDTATQLKDSKARVAKAEAAEAEAERQMMAIKSLSNTSVADMVSALVDKYNKTDGNVITAEGSELDWHAASNANSTAAGGAAAVNATPAAGAAGAAGAKPAGSAAGAAAGTAAETAAKTAAGTAAAAGATQTQLDEEILWHEQNMPGGTTAAGAEAAAVEASSPPPVKRKSGLQVDEDSAALESSSELLQAKRLRGADANAAAPVASSHAAKPNPAAAHP